MVSFQDVYLQVSLVTNVPDAGVVCKLFGSDSQVTTPLKMRMYLYWKSVLAGRVTTTVGIKEIKLAKNYWLIIYTLTTPCGIVVGVQRNGACK